MNLRLLDLLVCPIDKTPLELVAWETHNVPLSRSEQERAERLGIDPNKLSTRIETGVLLNRSRKLFYPIVCGVPRMLVFRTGIGMRFLEEHGECLRRELPGFALPQQEAMPGEEDVLRTFSREWLAYEWDGRSYWNLPPEQMYASMDFMLDLARKPVRHKRVLEVGIGIGGIADHVARQGECELVGVDLSYAVDAAQKHFGGNPFFHIVQASVFALPFGEDAFDFVYSQGVIHHTFSTRTAFDKLSKLPRIGGRLYIWVYSPEDERRNLIRRGLMLLETLIRPICWRLPERLQTAALLPLVPLYMLHQNTVGRHAQAGAVRYGFNEALHAARDRFTPRYVHRHSNEEVCQWFCEAGYSDLQCVSQRAKPDFVPISFTACTGVEGVRAGR